MHTLDHTLPLSTKPPGLPGFTAEVLVGNRPIMALFESGGFDIEKRREEGMYELKLVFRQP